MPYPVSRAEETDLARLIVQLEHPSVRIGSQVRGAVTVRSDSPIRAGGLRIELKAVTKARGVCVEREMSEDSYYDYTETSLGKRGFTAAIFKSSETIAGGSIRPGTHPFSVSIPLDVPPTFSGKALSISWYVEAVIDRPFRRDLRESSQLYVYPEVPRPEPTTVASTAGELRLEAVLPATALTPSLPGLITVAIGAVKPVRCKEVAAVLKRVENITYSEPGTTPTSTIACHADYSEVIHREVIARNIELGPDTPLTHQLPIHAPPIPSAETGALKVGLVLQVMCKKKGFLGGTESVGVLIPTTPS